MTQPKLTDVSGIVATARIVELLHPKTDEPVGVKITLLPQDDPKVKAEKRRIKDVNLVLTQKGKQITSAQLERNAVQMLKAAVSGWDWSNSTISFNGERPEFTPTNVDAFLSQVDWARDQLDEALADEKAFFQS